MERKQRTNKVLFLVVINYAYELLVIRSKSVSVNGFLAWS